MIDLHTHTIFSDGVLLPSEIIRRAEDLGVRVLSITDHADHSNLDWMIPRIVKACEENSRRRKIKVIPGVEITHAPPQTIGKLTEEARKLGARIVIVHGETPVEPVEPGTNLAAIEAGVDILAHPGFITEEEALLAAKKGVHFEITARKGHSLTNGHVAAMSLKCGVRLVLNTDSHAPSDLITLAFAKKVGMGAGLDEERYASLRANMEEIAKSKID